MAKILAHAVIAIGLATTALLGTSGELRAEESYQSRVSVTGAILAAKEANDGGEGTPYALILHVGTPVSTNITYEIGTEDCPSEGGYCHLVRSAINQPEYELQCVDPQTCVMPPGMSLSTANGTITGTPLSAGTWLYRPAVRDIVNGEDPFRGNGYWWTHYGKVDGKTFAISNSTLKLIVLAPPGDKEVKLTCTPAPGSTETLMLTLDLANGYVFELDGTAKPGAVSKIDPNSDLLGWKGQLHGFDFALDRSNGNLHGSFVAAGRESNWHCEKRAATRAF